MANDLTFRVIRGHAVPIRKGGKVGARIASSAVGAAAGAAAASLAPKRAKGQARPFQRASTAFAVAAGVLGGITVGKGLKGILAAQALSLGADVAATGLNAYGVSKIKGSNREKLREFGKREAINFGVGYSAFGATLLTNPAVRKKLAAWGARVVGAAL